MPAPAHSHLFIQPRSSTSNGQFSFFFSRVFFMDHFRDFTLTVLLSVVVRTAGEGQPCLIGSSQPIVAALGGDVILPCHVDPQVNVENLTVEWWRLDDRPDPTDPLSETKYVHRYHDNYDNEDMKQSSYAGRTALVKDELKHGNVSLKLKKVKLTDQGRYECQIPQLQSTSVIQLVVEPNSSETLLRSRNPQSPHPNKKKGGQFPLGGLILGLVVWFFVIVGTYLLVQKCQKLNVAEYDVASAEPLPA